MLAFRRKDRPGLQSRCSPGHRVDAYNPRRPTRDLPSHPAAPTDDMATETTNLHAEVLAANAGYVASFGDKGKLALPPARAAAFIVCMDARINPAAAFGLAEGDAHVIRNAGGRASDDAIRSLVISHKLLGTKEWFGE
jgi:hypothetical protein